MASGAAVSVRGRERFQVVDALNRDWGVLVDRHRGLVARWALQYEAFAGCESLDDALAAVQLTSDAGLRALLTEASTGDQLAARVVLQAMLGRMVRMALRDPKAGIDDYLSALWCQIQTYPLASRPDRIAANLSMDTFKSLRNDQRWLHRAEVLIWAPQMFLDEFAQGARVTWNLDGTEFDNEMSGDDILQAGRTRQLIDAPTQALLESVYLDGLDHRDVSQRHGSTPGSVRVRCSRAVRRLAAHARHLVDAA